MSCVCDGSTAQQPPDIQYTMASCMAQGPRKLTERLPMAIMAPTIKVFACYQTGSEKKRRELYIILLKYIHALCKQQWRMVVGENFRGGQLRNVAGIVARFERPEASGYKDGEGSRPIQVNPIETVTYST